jgi:CDI immunity proteins
MRFVDRTKSLQQLDGKDWGEPTYFSSLVVECHRLHRIRLNDFTIENLRIMISQELNLEYLIPLALERLCSNPLAEGKYYPGDLLDAVVRVNNEFWLSYPELRDEVAIIAKKSTSLFIYDPDECNDSWRKDVQLFLEKYSTSS